MNAQPAGDDLDKRLCIASEIAREAGVLARNMRAEGLTAEAKGRLDFVTEADRKVEALIATQLNAAFPDDGFLGEETGLTGGGAGCWVVDPIDGTSNYLNGLDHWSVSIAFTVGCRTVLGCVFAPDRNEIFEAAKDQGARLQGSSIQSKPADLDRLTFGLGISDRVPFSGYLDLLDRLNQSGIEHRRFGSGALSICDVAAGRLDAYFEHHINIWDVAAAAIIAQEAQADIAGFEDPTSFENGDRIYVSAPGLRDKVDLGSC